jgi:hypothetical protein
MSKRSYKTEVGGFSERLALYTERLYDEFKVVRIPTNGGYSSSYLGSGGAAAEPSRLFVYTGTTASSKAQLYSTVEGLNSGDIHHEYIDWTKRLEFEFVLARVNSDAQVSARIQLKESYAEGILAERGIGVSIANYTMTGEAYGTARGTVSIGTLTDNQTTRVKIILKDGSLEFWVNGELKGTLTGTAVPSVQGTASSYIVISIINGATGGVNAYLFASNLKIIQEW